MRAVWSFWTKPFEAHHRTIWFSGRHHLLAWVLSVETARKHYPQTALFTDEAGAELLVEGLRLPFCTVSTALSELEKEDPAWWVLGKLRTYQLQREPFVHIDNDVFLWSRLPRELETAAVLAQNPEWFPVAQESWYRTERFTRVLEARGGWMPPEWRSSAGRQNGKAVCCGIFGGNHLQFIRYYAGLAMRMIRHPANRPLWEELGANLGDNVLFEQYLLAACLDYHRDLAGSPYRGVRARFLFDSMAESFDEDAAQRAGYTHLIGSAKTNARLARALEKRVRREYPEAYERCCALGAAQGMRGPSRNAVHLRRFPVGALRL